MNEEKKIISIGELAENAGVSVRTLQYYDRTGLLKSKLSEGGRRMYSSEDVFKLQQILFYKSFGFSLEEIAEKIFKYDSISDLENIFSKQRDILAGQIGNLSNILKMLDTLISEIKSSGNVGLDKLMSIIYLMKQGNPYAFVLRYFSDKQMKDITQRFQSSEALEDNEKFIENAKGVFAELNDLYLAGADPAGTEGQKLAERWWNMVMEFTHGDQGLLKTLVSAGMDIGSWPDESKDFREAIKNFLGTALNIYLAGKNINLSEMEAKYNG